MKRFEGGLAAAALAAAALALGAGTAAAGPMGGPYSANGGVELTVGSWTTTCSLTLEGYEDDVSVDDAQFGSCYGAFGRPWANELPWSISWNGNQGEIAFDISTYFALTGGTCRYRDTVQVAFLPEWEAIYLQGHLETASYSTRCPNVVEIEGPLDVWWW